MDKAQAAISAAVGAVVAVGVSLAVNHIKEIRFVKQYNADNLTSYENGRERGYEEGREAVWMAQLQPAAETHHVDQ